VVFEEQTLTFHIFICRLYRWDRWDSSRSRIHMSTYSIAITFLTQYGPHYVATALSFRYMVPKPITRSQ